MANPEFYRKCILDSYTELRDAALDVPGEPCAIFKYPYVSFPVIAPLAWLGRV